MTTDLWKTMGYVYFTKHLPHFTAIIATQNLPFIHWHLWPPILNGHSHISFNTVWSLYLFCGSRNIFRLTWKWFVIFTSNDTSDQFVAMNNPPLSTCFLELKMSSRNFKELFCHFYHTLRFRCPCLYFQHKIHVCVKFMPQGRLTLRVLSWRSVRMLRR